MPGYFRNFPLTYYDVVGDGNYYLTVDLLRRFRIRDTIKYSTEYYFMYPVADLDTPEIVAHKIYGDVDHHWVVLMMNDIVDPRFDWVLSQLNLNAFVENKYPDECLFVWNIAAKKNFIPNEIITDSIGNTATVARWSPTYRRLETAIDGGFAEGTTITGSTSGCTAIVRRRVLENPDAMHHLTDGADASLTATILDPYDTDNNYLSGYIVGGIETNAVTNRNYEEAVNEDKRNIRILHPNYLDQILTDAKTVLSRSSARTDILISGE